MTQNDSLALTAPGAAREAYAIVANTLRATILRGELEIGEKLPDEGQLCAMFHVSRSTIREALRTLGSQSLIKVVRGKGGGIFVTQPRIQDLTDGLSAMFGLVAGTDECTIEELVRARTLLEVYAVRNAALSRSKSDIEYLRETLPSRDRTARIPRERSFDSNYNFHAAILRVANNRVIEAIAVPIFSTLHYRVHRRSAKFPVSKTLAEHWKLLEAIAEGDPDQAADLMRGHLEGLKPVYAALDRRGRPGARPASIDGVARDTSG